MKKNKLLTTVIAVCGIILLAAVALGFLGINTYNYDHAECVEKLTYMVESFVEWVEGHRDMITDKKIFNQLEAA